MEATKEQTLAFSLGGDSLLVSAAAGSGKTSVLTERVIRKLANEKSGSRADSLMILTFTEAAAAEMRTRITKRLRELAKADPENEYIKKQLMLLPSARISTIHAACLNIVRNNFQLCGIDPQFTIGDERELELMKTAELEDFLEEIYEMAESSPEIKSVIEYFTAGRDDSNLVSTLSYLSEYLSKQPYEQDFIDYACNMPFDTLLENIFSYICELLSDIELRYDRLIERTSDHPQLTDVYSQDRDHVLLLKKFALEKDLEKLLEENRNFEYIRHPSLPKNSDFDKNVWKGYNADRTELKAKTNSVFTEYLYTDRAGLEADRELEMSVIGPLMSLCKTLNDRLFEKRKKQRTLSFDDIERFALSLLIEGFDDGKPVRSALARELSTQIDEIIVDEYQDCNRVQDLIFYALSKDETNIFMVGDVKQSIYSFRNAEPALFLEKQRSSNPVTDLVPLTAPSRVDLNKNFRSDKKILDFVNSVFEPLMTPENDGIDYSDGHAFVTESDAPPSESEVQIHLLLSGTGENSPLVKLSRMQAEAKYVADKIKSLLESATVFDKDTKKKRKAVPSDIAVLMRAPKVDSQCFENAFKEAGIPYINNNPSENYLDTSEVRSVLAYLQVINNPYDDVPLVTLMYSDFFGFSATELANIRIEAKHALFFDAVKKYAKKDNKTAEFLKKIEYLRSLSLTTDVYGIISAVYETSGILLRVSEKENSEAVKANLMLLLDYAEGFEADRYRGLFSFINYILKLSEKGDAIPAAKLKKSGGSVNILSVHGSKGLEYPIVFFVGAGTEMQRKGENVIQTDLSLGVGGYVRDSKLHREFESSARKLLIEKKREKGLEEAKRLLYVALTRPRDHLYITASMNASDFEKSMLSVYRTNGYPNRFDIDEKASFIKWMMYSLIRTEAGKTLCTAAGVPCDLCTDPSVADVMVTNVTEYEAEKQTGKQLKPTLEIDKEEAKVLISRQYSHISDLSLPSKLSVSEIKGLRNNTPDSEPVFEKRAYFKKPSFITGGTGKDKGNATHHFLQFCDFDKITDMHSLLEEKQRLVEYEFITEKEAKLVEDEKVLRFLTSETMKKLSESDKCEKEKRFIFTLPANELMDTDSKSEIIVQGILDCLYVKDGKAIIVDYKTDTVSDAGILLSRYSAQLDMYEKAVKHIMGMDTYKKYIYSFCLEQFIEV